MASNTAINIEPRKLTCIHSLWINTKAESKINARPLALANSCFTPCLALFFTFGDFLCLLSCYSYLPVGTPYHTGKGRTEGTAKHTNKLRCVPQIYLGAGNWEGKGWAIHGFTASVEPGESSPPSHTPSPHGWPDAILQTSLTIKSSSVFTLQGSTGSMRHLCKIQAHSSLLQKFEHSALDLSTNKRPG